MSLKYNIAPEELFSKKCYLRLHADKRKWRIHTIQLIEKELRGKIRPVFIKIIFVAKCIESDRFDSYEMELEFIGECDEIASKLFDPYKRVVDLKSAEENTPVSIRFTRNSMQRIYKIEHIVSI